MLWDVSSIDRQTISDLAGSASFVVWLFAQSPQLYENYRNSSCDGLSVVFLIQWMAGDVTNLIGCLLTQQLPFQVAVATYFCCIDLCILVQYYYYLRRDRLLALQNKDMVKKRLYGSYMSSSVPNMRSSSIIPSSSRARRISPSRSPIREPSQMSRVNSRPAITRTYDSTQSVKTLTERARNMTGQADEYERRVHEKEARRRLWWRRGRKELLKKIKSTRSKDAKSRPSDHLYEGDEEAQEVESSDLPTQMTDSILSDSSNGDFGYGFGTASTILDPIPQEEVINERGRDMTRTAGRLVTNQSQDPPAGLPPQAARTKSTLQSLLAIQSRHNVEPDEPTRRTFTRSDSRRSMQSSTTHRGAGMVLLSFAALFALQGSHTNPYHRTDLEAIDYSRGKIFNIPGQITPARPSLISRTTLTWYHTSLHSFSATNRYQPPAPTWERIVGRISAWTCTVLYMTSRLPQIWTNLNRRSVQGLSILLFLSAALGNALYSLSVLANPLASSDTRFDYLWESLPFLLGSGGTLIFDAIIVSQWIAWRGKEPIFIDLNPKPNIMTSSFVRSVSRTAASRHRRRNDTGNWATLENQPLLEHM